MSDCFWRNQPGPCPGAEKGKIKHVPFCRCWVTTVPLDLEAGGQVVVKGPSAKKATDSAELSAVEAGSKRCLGDGSSAAPGEAASY